MKNLSIRQKLIIVFTITLLGPITVICLILGFQVREHAVKLFVTSTEKQLKLADQAMFFYVDGLRSDVNLLAEHPAMKKIDETLINYSDTKFETLLDPVAAGG